ncbi:MAG: lipocalin-like domain-containing protein [Pseudomonadota bacterium]
MGAEAPGFTMPQPNPRFSFPKDHGPHPDFRIEWWYVTANLKGSDGADYGVQWTLFRTALRPPAQTPAKPWSSPQLWFCHAAMTGADFHHATERYARGGTGQAGVTASPSFEAWCDDWRIAGPSFDKLTLKASGPEFAYTLALEADGPLVFHGDKGFSVKSTAGQASYYYSQPNYAVTGQLEDPSGPIQVTGRAWLDREWSSKPLAENQTGWDWFSLHFDDDTKLMTYRLRESDGPSYATSTWMDAAGTSQLLGPATLSVKPLDWTKVAGRSVPTRWALKGQATAGPARGVDVIVEALNPRAWMKLSIPYWEGPVRITGSHSGIGYLEMTGYD